MMNMPEDLFKNILFRRAEKADLAAIVQILADDVLGREREKTGSPGQAIDPAYIQAFDEINRDLSEFLAVAVRLKDQEIIGTLQISFLPGLSRGGTKRGQIEAVRVVENCQGQGIGRAFLLWATELCRKQGCGLVQLTSDKSRKEAHRFYESLGFVASHEGFKLKI